MIHSLLKNNLNGAALLILAMTLRLSAQSIEPIGGPYTSDSNTILLLHFEGDFSNESAFKGDATGFGQARFVPVSAKPELGQALFLKNDAASDSSFVTAPDSDPFDLSGDWTMEAWVNVQAFGADNTDHRFAPTIFQKPGFSTFDQGNYFLRLFGDTGRFSSGYCVAGKGCPEVNSPNDIVRPQAWFHIAAIRSTEHHLLLQLIHDANMNLLFFGSSTYDPKTQTQPILTSRELFIGTNGGAQSQSSFMDGWLDEIRISNVVRNFAIPPVITKVTTISNQAPDVSSYPAAQAEVEQIGGSEITDVFLNYDSGNGFQQIQMIATAGSALYSAQIPTQANATTIYYYIEAENMAGQRNISPTAAENPVNPSLYSFAMETPNTNTLNLNFEGGALPLIDNSPYNHRVSVSGLPLYNGDAIEGNYSFNFHKVSQDAVELITPLVGNSEEFSMDFWINPSSMDGFWNYIISKPAIQPGLWDKNSFEIIGQAFDDPQRKLTAGKFSKGEHVRITLPVSLDLDKWHHVIYEIRKAPIGDKFNYYLLFQINDANDDKLAADFKGFNQSPQQTFHPMRIGEAAGRGVWFDGKLDAINTYNYWRNLVEVDAAPQVAVPEPLGNQEESVTGYTILAKADSGLGGKIKTVDLHYNDGAGWQTRPMTNSGDSLYSVTLPQLATFSVIYYYVAAVNANGLRAIAPAEAENAVEPAWFSFAVEVPETKTMALEFEEGSGAIVESSQYNHLLNIQGNPIYDTNAADGNFCISLEGDSSLIEVHSPLITQSNEWTIEFWMNADEFRGPWQFIANKPSFGRQLWGENSVDIVIGSFDNSNATVGVGIFDIRNGSTRLQLEKILASAAWHHIIVEVAESDSDSNYILTLALRDLNGAIVEKKSVVLPNLPRNNYFPLRIGKAGGDRPFFKGKIDAFHAYNYTPFNLVTSIKNPDDSPMPIAFFLSQNFPNPFNPETKIHYSLPVASDIKIQVFDILGRKVRTLLDRRLPAGAFSIIWDGRNDANRAAASGVYFYRLDSDHFSQTRKMLLLR